MFIHKFFLNNLYIVLDINSGAVHSVDELIYDLLDVYDGSDKSAHKAKEVFKNKYTSYDIEEALGELDYLKENGLLFVSSPPVPAMFQQKTPVKSLCLNVAHDCNLRCKYCFASTGSFGNKRELMDFETGKAAVEFLIENSQDRNNLEIDFFGGEPLLNIDNVKKLITYIREREKETNKEFNLTLTTNATILTDDIIQYLNENEISLVLSLDGREDIHDFMRPYSNGQASYQDIIGNIKRVVNSRNDQKYYIRGTYTKNNLDFATDVIHMADQGFTQLSVEPVVGDKFLEKFKIQEEDVPALEAEYEKLAFEFLDRNKAGTGFNFFHFNIDLENGPCLVKRLRACGSGYEYFAVDPKGDIYPCHQFVGQEEFLIGNVFDGELNEEISAKFKEAYVLNKPKCRECWARFYCSGGCQANNILINKNILEPYEIGCKLQKKRLECAIMIQVSNALCAEENPI